MQYTLGKIIPLVMYVEILKVRRGMRKENRGIHKSTVPSREIDQTVRKLLENASISRIIVRKADGDILMILPINPNVSYEGRVAMAKPSLLALNSLSDMVKDVTVEAVFA